MRSTRGGVSGAVYGYKLRGSSYEQGVAEPGFVKEYGESVPGLWEEIKVWGVSWEVGRPLVRKRDDVLMAPRIKNNVLCSAGGWTSAFARVPRAPTGFARDGRLVSMGGVASAEGPLPIWRPHSRQVRRKVAVRGKGSILRIRRLSFCLPK
ncbi:hypothetical protein VUR80DRAFT_1534 [Thermomyces stellatus]